MKQRQPPTKWVEQDQGPGGTVWHNDTFPIGGEQSDDGLVAALSTPPIVACLPASSDDVASQAAPASSNGLPRSGRRAPEGANGPTANDTLVDGERSTEIDSVSCPAVPPPEGILHDGRVWYTDGAVEGMTYGCASLIGPPSVAEDKDNEDLAFAVQRNINGEIWLLVGVADGVSNSTWGERGAAHASAVYIEVISELLRKQRHVEKKMQDAQARARLFNQPFLERLQQRMAADERQIVAQRWIHPSWDARRYSDKYLLRDEAAEMRKEWFQTTLLAAALGPFGGFALFLGDGFARVDRHQPNGQCEVRVVPTQRWTSKDDRAPEVQISHWLTEKDVESGFRGILPQGAARLGITLATDGVSKSPRHGLDADSMRFRDSVGCKQFLESLAKRSPGDVEADNMSVAFATRSVKP